MSWQFQVDNRVTQPYIYTYPFSPRPLLSRLPRKSEQSSLYRTGGKTLPTVPVYFRCPLQMGILDGVSSDVSCKGAWDPWQWICIDDLSGIMRATIGHTAWQLCRLLKARVWLAVTQAKELSSLEGLEGPSSPVSLEERTLNSPRGDLLKVTHLLKGRTGAKRFLSRFLIVVIVW